MEPKRKSYPLIVIVGVTASGKSELALELAKRLNVEIISADSRSIYRGLDIGTAKPTKSELTQVKHHLIDVVEPDQYFSVADFQYQANSAINKILSKNRIPILVGGSGLYIDSVIFNYEFSPENSSLGREYLNKLSLDELQLMVKNLGVRMPKDPENSRRLIRAIETGGVSKKRSSLRPDTLVIGLNIERAKLEENIRKRINNMVDLGLVEEIKRLSERYGWDSMALQSTSYKAFRSYISGESSLDDAKNEFAMNDMRIARRQRTWFARNESIQWVESREIAVDLVTTFLNKYM